MHDCLRNTWSSLRQAWNYGDNVSIEQDVWQNEKVRLYPSTISPARQPRHLLFRFGSVTRRLQQMVLNCFSPPMENPAHIHNKLHVGNGRYCSIIHLPGFRQDLILLTDPTLIKPILERHRNETGEEALISGGIITETARKVLGDNPLTFEPDRHQDYKQRVGPHFTNTQSFHKTVFEVAQKKIDHIFRSQDTSVEIHPFLPSMIVEAICRCLLTSEPIPDEINDQFFESITNAINTTLRIVGKKTRTYEENAAYENALQQISRAASLIKEAQPPFESDDIDSIIKFMFYAGQDTTSALIEFLIFVLGKSAYEWQEKLYTEWCNSNLNLFEFVQQSKELEWVVKEALRLHPPSFGQTRISLDEFSFGETYSVPRGAKIHLFHLSSQRDVRRWGPDADEFKPHRHQHSNKKHVMYPFSFGPTSCVGKPLTSLLVKAFLITLISKYSWRTLTEFEKYAEGNIALKIDPNVEIFLEHR